jgi:hypothetical protein
MQFVAHTARLRKDGDGRGARPEAGDRAGPPCEPQTLPPPLPSERKEHVGEIVIIISTGTEQDAAIAVAALRCLASRAESYGIGVIKGAAVSNPDGDTVVLAE